jgi:hypothetical protein
LKAGSAQVGSFEIRHPEICALEVGASQIRLTQIGCFQIDTIQSGVTEKDLPQHGPFELSSGEIGRSTGISSRLEPLPVLAQDFLDVLSHLLCLGEGDDQ